MFPQTLLVFLIPVWSSQIIWFLLLEVCERSSEHLKARGISVRSDWITSVHFPPLGCIKKYSFTICCRRFELGCYRKSKEKRKRGTNFRRDFLLISFGWNDEGDQTTRKHVFQNLRRLAKRQEVIAERYHLVVSFCYGHHLHPSDSRQWLEWKKQIRKTCCPNGSSYGSSSPDSSALMTWHTQWTVRTRTTRRVQCQGSCSEHVSGNQVLRSHPFKRDPRIEKRTATVTQGHLTANWQRGESKSDCTYCSPSETRGKTVLNFSQLCHKAHMRENKTIADPCHITRARDQLATVFGHAIAARWNTTSKQKVTRCMRTTWPEWLCSHVGEHTFHMITVAWAERGTHNSSVTLLLITLCPLAIHVHRRLFVQTIAMHHGTYSVSYVPATLCSCLLVIGHW